MKRLYIHMNPSEGVERFSEMEKERREASARKMAILSETYVEQRTFRHWADLLPELQNVVIEFLDPISTHSFSMTCGQYQTRHRHADRFSADYSTTITELCCIDTPARYLWLFVKWMRHKPEFMIDYLAYCLALNARYPWMSWLINDLVPEDRKTRCIEEASRGAMEYAGIDVYMWMTNQPWGLPFSDIEAINTSSIHRIDLMRITESGNSALIDYLLANRPWLDLDDLRKRILMHAFNVNCRKFFNQGILFQNIEWDNAWTTLQEMWLDDNNPFTFKPQYCQGHWSYSSNKLWFYIEIWPHLSPQTRNTLFLASREWQTCLIETALRLNSLDALKALESYNFPLKILIKCSRSILQVTKLFRSTDGIDLYIWLWEHDFFNNYYDDNEITLGYSFYKEIKEAIWEAHDDPTQVPNIEKYLTMYPFKGSSLILDAIKLGSKIREFIPC